MAMCLTIVDYVTMWFNQIQNETLPGDLPGID